MDPAIAKHGTELFFQAANVTNLHDARSLDTERLQLAGMQAVANAPFNHIYFSATVDGELIKEPPGKSYSSGNFIKNVSVITSDNQNETRFIGNQRIQNDSDVDNWVISNFPSAPQSFITYVTNTLYPAKNASGQYPTSARSLYSTPQQRSDLMTKDFMITCNSIVMAKAYQDVSSYYYEFRIPPAIHAQDLAYTYFPNTETTPFDASIAVLLQKYIAQFVLEGSPNGPYHVPYWANYKQSSNTNPSAIAFTRAGSENITLTSVLDRCEFWNKEYYFPVMVSWNPLPFLRLSSFLHLCLIGSGPICSCPI